MLLCAEVIKASPFRFAGIDKFTSAPDCFVCGKTAGKNAPCVKVRAKAIFDQPFTGIYEKNITVIWCEKCYNDKSRWPIAFTLFEGDC